MFNQNILHIISGNVSYNSQDDKGTWKLKPSLTGVIGAYTW